MPKFNPGDRAWIVESTIFVVEVEVVRYSGGFYGPKVWHSNDKYRKVIWQCNKKFKEKEHRCDTPTLNEVAIKQMFIKAYNLMMEENTEVIKYTKDLIDELSNFDYLDDLINAQKLEIEIIEEKSI